jgi:glycerol-3-phosphate O-acyltransferase/dihydroxyacetone phosphate acyltransferase
VQLHEKIGSGTFDAPSWDYIRTAKLAARIYAPLGTMMSLGDYVRISRSFLEAFKAPDDYIENDADIQELQRLQADLKVKHFYLLKVHIYLTFWHQSYQDQLSKLGIKDDRIRRPLSRKTICSRLVLRLLWSCCLFTISLPGLLLWLPIFITTFIAVHNFKKTGPIFDTWDEIAQYKLTYGLVSGLCVWAATVAFTWQYVFVTVCLTPALMWMTLRWFEDAVSSFRAFTALYRLLRVGKSALMKMREVRKDLHRRIMGLAVSKLNLPAEPESYFVLSGGREKGRVRGKWDSSARYFSIKRRRKRDWDETLRLYDKVD